VLGLSGFTAGLTYAVVSVKPEHYFEVLLIMSPGIALLSIPIGGLVYAGLARLQVRFTIPVCILAGAIIGSLPGVLFWAIAQGLSPGQPIPENLAIENRLLPFFWGSFGAVGGLAFPIFARLFRL
jgi:hypothetical protein